MEQEALTTTEQQLQQAMQTIGTLMRTIESLNSQLEEANQRIKVLTAQLAWCQRQMFGRRSEKHLQLEGQLDLFTDAQLADTLAAQPAEPEGQPEEQSEQQPEQPSQAQPEKQRPAPKSKTRQNWDNLPVLETEYHEPESVDLTRYRRIGEEVTYVVEYKPGMLYRVAHIRPKYGLKDSTEDVERGQGVIIAPMPLLPIYKGIPGASLLAEILLQKYEYHAPFYRQIKKFAHLGMTGLKETTLVGWFKRAMELLRPLYDKLVEEVFKGDYCQADETTVGVINNHRHQADKEYLWMVRDVMERIAVFFYDEGSRAGGVIKELTDKHHFKGYLQCDGFSGYTAAYKPGSGVTLVNCLVHIRRHFERALDENRKEASWFLCRIQELYHIEHECDRNVLSPEERKQVRLAQSKPLMEEMRTWMETEGLRYSQRTLLGQAVSYAYTRWTNMEHVLEDGRLLLDNNLAENEIRPITLGRKNYLFCGNHEAAGNMCVITSLLATCHNHNVNPRLYLCDTIARMPYKENAPAEELLDLLPHRWIKAHPEAVIENLRDNIK